MTSSVLRSVRLEALGTARGELLDLARRQLGRPGLAADDPWRVAVQRAAEPDPRPPGRPRRKLRPLAEVAEQVERLHRSGRTRRQAARKLGITDAALRSRLAAARSAGLVAPTPRGRWDVQLTERGRWVLEQGGDV